VKERDVELVHVRTNEHVADIFTKPLKIKKCSVIYRRSLEL
jgi:hypothetical protein